jgi:lysophospholipase L1-like esterase
MNEDRLFMKKEVLLFFASLTVSAILGIVFLEIYFSDEYWLGNFFTHNGKSHNTQFNSKLGWNTKSNTVHIEDEITYTTNSLGFRSEEIDLAKKQILVIGDSITWGMGVQDNENIPYYLNNRFKEYQVLNLGVMAYGVDQYYLNLKEHIDKLNPILIIIIICMANDLENTSSEVSYGKSKPLFVVDKNKLNLKSGETRRIDPDNILLTNSNISINSCQNVFTKSWTLSQPFFQSIRDTVCKTKTLNTLDLQYVILSLFYKIEKLAKENNTKILFALSPPEIKNMKEGGNMGKDDVFHITFFQNMFRGIRFPYVDFFEVINKRHLDTKKLYLDGIHYTPLGNKLFADSIYETIKINKMIPLSLNKESGA